LKWFTPTQASPPLEPKRRQEAAALLREFAAGRISNDALEEDWPLGPGDPALNGVFEQVWYFYDDNYTHTFRGNEAGAKELLRLAEFLESDVPYLWKSPPAPIKIAAFFASVLTLGLARHLWEPWPEHWPFPTPEVANRFRS
jgi:hypothetical protein